MFFRLNLQVTDSGQNIDNKCELVLHGVPTMLPFALNS